MGKQLIVGLEERWRSAPHILGPAELICHTGQKDEEVLQEEGDTRIARAWLEIVVLVLTHVYILAKKDVGTPCTKKSH